MILYLLPSSEHDARFHHASCMDTTCGMILRLRLHILPHRQYIPRHSLVMMLIDNTIEGSCVMSIADLVTGERPPCTLFCCVSGLEYTVLYRSSVLVHHGCLLY